MYQVWRFIAPGLYANEKRMVAPFVALTSAGALGGAVFSHYVLFPALMAFYAILLIFIVAAVLTRRPTRGIRSSSRRR
jgi:Sec-independent protein secretion pathway component TatC